MTSLKPDPDAESVPEGGVGFDCKPIKVKLKTAVTQASEQHEQQEIIIKKEEADSASVLCQEMYNMDEEMPEVPKLGIAPKEPIHKGMPLKWDHPMDLIGEKVCDPMIHCCELCKLPILAYGRMIACKHVLCAQCAAERNVIHTGCPRCKDPVARVERVALGLIFMCTVGGKKHDFEGCRRTYLSRRDLMAHMAHRHQNQAQSATAAVPAAASKLSPLTYVTTAPPTSVIPASRPPPPLPSNNLITVPIQEQDYRRPPPPLPNHMQSMSRPPPPSMNRPPPTIIPPPGPPPSHPPAVTEPPPGGPYGRPPPRLPPPGGAAPYRPRQGYFY